MERFRPDNWYELWLRPFLMLDPGSGVYFEFPAPDLRFTALIVLALLLLLTRRWSVLSPLTRRMTVGLLVTMWAWSYVSGNGRYFLPGLLFVGPLIVALIAATKVTRSMRWTLLGFVLVGQAAVVATMYVPSPLANLKWIDTNVLGLPDSPLRNEPAVFTAVGGNSQSALATRFHPESRWIALMGHYSVGPVGVEHDRLLDAVASSMKKYVIAEGAREPPEKREKAAQELRTWLTRLLAAKGLKLVDEPCQFLERRLNAARPSNGLINLEEPGRWFCRFETEADRTVHTSAATVPQLHRDAFTVVERMCPRFFPPAGGQDYRGDGVSFRVYPGTDTQLRARDDGSVAYRYQLTLNATFVGTTTQILAGTASISCDKLDGRYQLPWNR